jgi:hypothetical protein
MNANMIVQNHVLSPYTVRKEISIYIRLCTACIMVMVKILFEQFKQICGMFVT